MAPVQSRDIIIRSLPPTKVTIIIICILAGLSAVGAVLWLAAPRLRGRYFCFPIPRRSRTSHNYPPETNGGVSRTAVQGLVEGGLSGATLTSNTELNSLHQNGNSDLSVAIGTAQATPSYLNVANYSNVGQASVYQERLSVVSGQSLFSGSYNDGQEQTTSHNVTRPQLAVDNSPNTKEFAEEPHTQLHGEDFGDAREFILTVPEPLSIKSAKDQQPAVEYHNAESSSVVAGTLSSSVASDKHLHPNKLFKQIEAQGNTGNICSGLVASTQNALDSAAHDFERHRQYSVDLDQPGPSTLSEMFGSVFDQDGRSVSVVESLSDDDETTPHNASIAAMHRLRTYRSLVGAPPPMPLTRAGTLTRPKTPVAEIRNLYDRNASASRSTPAISRNNTVSTKFGAASDDQSLVSSTTSPPKTAPGKFTPSSASLLPTPLRIMRSEDSRSFTSPTPATVRHEDEPERALRPIPFVEEADLRLPQHYTLFGRHPEPPARSMRPRPAPLDFGDDAHDPKLRSVKTTRDLDQAGGAIFGQKRPMVGNKQASSLYSRDTQGQSIARTPALPSSHQIAARRTPFAPVTHYTMEEASSSEDLAEASFVNTKDKAFEASRRIIDNWARDSTISTEYAQSELDLTDASAPALRISGPSLYIETNTAQRRSRLRASLSDTAIAVKPKGPAPGGADWI